MFVWEILNRISGRLPLRAGGDNLLSIMAESRHCDVHEGTFYSLPQFPRSRPRNPGPRMEEGEEVMSLKETCRSLQPAAVLRHAREAGCCGRTRTPLLPPDSLCLVRLHFEHVLGHLGAVQRCLNGLEERMRVVGVRDVLDQQLARLYDLVLILE